MIRIPKIRLKYFLIALPFIVSIPSVFVLALERFTTSDQRFCLTCHYQMWGKDFLVDSKVHPPEVRCPECHATEHVPFLPPKDFASDPSRVNVNCMRCHGEMVERSDVEGFKYNVMKIQFPHKLHLQEVGALCTDCHYNVKHDKHIPQTNRPRMVACFECHDQETTSCLKCHPKGEHLLLSLLPRHETIAKPVCEQCHEGFEDRVQVEYGIRFKHAKHLENGIACGTCHENKNQHGVITKQRSECMACHHGDEARACTDCHATQVAMRSGKLLGIPGEPDVMAADVECDVCHAEVREGHDPQAIRQTCADCHEDAVLAKLDEIQRRVSAELARIGGRFDVLQDGHSAGVVVAGEILDDLRGDGSRGFHNAKYADILLQRADELISAEGRAEVK
ncbi:MAG TPA: multiheme c-type cytochrome [bacterium]|jgi:hypothetical protein